MHFSAAKLLAFAAALAPTAVSAVTPILAQGGCSSVPGYEQEAPKQSYPFVLKAFNTIAPVSGHGVSYRYYDNVTTRAEYAIVINNQEAKGVIRCRGSTALDTTWEGLGSNGQGWVPVGLSGTRDAARLKWGVIGAELQAYWHDVEGQGHLYLGSNGVTTWAIKEDASAGVWRIRLLLPGCNAAEGEGLQEGEEETFLIIS